MNEEELREYLKKYLRIEVDLDDRSNQKMHIITLMLGREVINETKLWL